MNTSYRVTITALTVAALPMLSSLSCAAPVHQPLSLQSAVGPSVETVQFRRGGRGFRGGAGVGAGIAGVIIGGAMIGAMQQPYGYPYGPYYGRRAYYPGYAIANPYPMSDPVSYCLQRFRSYDPMSGTYLGFDGYRHPCP